MYSISVTMPAYNEEPNIGEMIEDSISIISKITDDYEVIAVDDGSADGTARVIQEKAEIHPQVRWCSMR